MISPSELRAAAQAIRDGKLVAFPTETVYGLGANALDAAAVAGIFAAKGRPANHPLIVHVASIEQARSLAAEWSSQAEALARRFWPGPLTLIVPKHASVPDMVTAGLDSVGLRMPAHDVALALIREAGVPIAAPSANRFTELSPTRAEHVVESLGDRVAVLLDGGPTSVGIESTVIALTGGAPELLRPGSVTRAEIEAVAGPLRVTAPMDGLSSEPHRSPGQHQRHYQPRSPLLLATWEELPRSGGGVFLSLSDIPSADWAIAMPRDARAYAACLYAVLHEADAGRPDWIAVEPPPLGDDWDAVRDRLERARRK